VLVRDLLGHSTISITADIYCHVLPPYQDALAERMERLYEEPATAGGAP
jgi:site-specific recombinase XerD